MAARIGAAVTFLAGLVAIVGFVWDRMPDENPVPPTPLPTTSTPAASSSIPVAGELRILTPSGAEPVPRCVPIVVTGPTREGHDLWVGVRSEGMAGNYFLRKLDQSADGRWTAPPMTVGEKGAPTKKFSVFAAHVPKEVSRQLQAPDPSVQTYPDAWLTQNHVEKAATVEVQRLPDNGGC